MHVEVSVERSWRPNVRKKAARGLTNHPHSDCPSCPSSKKSNLKEGQAERLLSTPFPVPTIIHLPMILNVWKTCRTSRMMHMKLIRPEMPCAKTCGPTTDAQSKPLPAQLSN